MFSESEVKFILENAERDLGIVNERIERYNEEMSVLGMNLHNAREARDKIKSIVDTIKKALEEEEND